MKIRSSLNGWNGYSVEEVDEFLDQVTEELEKKCKEVSALNKELEQMKKELSDTFIENNNSNALKMTKEDFEKLFTY